MKKSFEADGALVQLNLWDTAGQERFNSITRWQYRNVQGIILVYDITDKSTFDHLSFWINSIENDVSHRDSKYETIPLIIIGNKLDLEANRQVKEKDGRKLAEKEMAFGFFETSAKTGTNVFQLFQKLAYHITEVCDPELMKSFHPYMLRPPEILQKTESTMQQIMPPPVTESPKKLKKSKKRKSVLTLRRRKKKSKKENSVLSKEQLIEMKLKYQSTSRKTTHNTQSQKQVQHRKTELKYCCVIS